MPEKASAENAPSNFVSPGTSASISRNTAEADRRDARPTVPDYDLLRLIGRGAYGEVWLARSTTGLYRAVKIVRRSAFDHDRPFEREFDGIQKFEPISLSESQVHILHVGRNDAGGYLYYVMELADRAEPRPDSYVAAEVTRLTSSVSQPSTSNLQHGSQSLLMSAATYEP